MNRIKVSLIVFLLFFSFRVYADDSVSQSKKSFLWEVRSKTNTVYLLGSVHFMKKDAYPLPRKIEDAFDASRVLAVEANVNEKGGLDIQKLKDRALYADDDTLEKHVSKETYARVKETFGNFGIPPMLVNKQKPWILALTLTSLGLVKLGFDPEYGIDIHFLKEASGKKKIRELESVDYQIDLLSNFPQSEQEGFLIYTLDNLSSMENDADRMLRAWNMGDTKAMESLISKNEKKDSRLDVIYEKLIYERNRNMAAKIEGYLASDETCFVVVGAGHLVGDRGIIELLKRKGYDAKQL